MSVPSPQQPHHSLPILRRPPIGTLQPRPASPNRRRCSTPTAVHSDDPANRPQSPGTTSDDDDESLDRTTASASSADTTTTTTTSSTTPTLRRYLAAAVAVALLAIAFVYLGHPDTSESPPADCTFDSLAVRHPGRPAQLWLALRAGLRAVRPPAPVPQQLVLLLVGQPTADDDRLTQDIAAETHRCLAGRHSDGLRLLDVGRDFHAPLVGGDYGPVVVHLGALLRRHSVLLLADRDLRAVRPDAVRALHFVCDSGQPPVERSAVLLRLTLDGGDALAGRTALERAERALTGAWADALHGDELQPLLARLTDRVLALH